MGKIEEQYKNHHHNRQETDFDRAEIWKSVSADLDAKQRKSNRFIWFLGMLALFGLVITFMANHKESISLTADNLNSELTHVKTLPNKVNNASGYQENNETSKDSGDDIYSIDEQGVSDLSFRPQPDVDEEPMNSLFVDKNQSNSLLKHKIQSEIAHLETHENSGTQETKTLDTVNAHQNNNHAIESSNQAKTSRDHQSFRIEKLQVIPCGILPLHQPPINLPSFSRLETNKQRIELSICSGFNQSNLHFDNADVDFETLNISTSRGLGWGIRGYVTFINKYNLRLSTGVGLDELNTVFDYSNTITFEGFQSDGLIGFVQDGDDIIPLLGERPVTISQTRIVKHHNQIKMLSAPLLIGRQFKKVRHSLCLEVGITPRLVLSQKGRNVNQQNDIIDFDENPNSIPLKPFQISLSFHGSYRYAINDRLSAQASVLFDQGIGRFSELHNQKVRFSQVAMQTGIIYSMYSAK